MVKNVFEKDSFVEVEVAYTIKQTTYYYLRVNKQTIDDEHVSAIVEILDHEPTEQDKKILYQKYLAMLKSVKLGEIIDYCKSDTIKVFEIDGVKGWLDSEERGSIRRAALDKASEGREEFTLYLSGVGIEMSPIKVEEILKAVEVYASDCFDKAESHKTALGQLNVIEDVENYDIKSGYPEHPVFSTKNKE